jgi:hypothetical protein
MNRFQSWLLRLFFPHDALRKSSHFFEPGTRVSGSSELPGRWHGNYQVH